MTTDSGCIFCKIVAGNPPAHVVAQTDRAFAFLDILPLVDGHTMVVSKRHCERLEDMSDEDVGAVFGLVREVSRAQKKVLGVDATTIGINNGADAGQVVPHLHVHVVPRRADDGGGNVHSIVRTAATLDLTQMCARLAEALGDT